MKIETFTLRSNDTGGVAALLPCTIKMLLPEVGSGIG